MRAWQAAESLKERTVRCPSREAAEQDSPARKCRVGGSETNRVPQGRHPSARTTQVLMATATISKRTSLHTQKQPAPGRFGVYGGRYVPETLMAALEELEREYEKAKRDREIPATPRPTAEDIRRPPHAAILRQPPDRKTWRRENLSQARRPAPHRRAQDQQLPRPSAAGRTHGQAPHHRRNRRRPARRRHGHRLRAASASSAWSTWAPKTCAARNSTSSACGCWARRFAASIPARAR